MSCANRFLFCFKYSLFKQRSNVIGYRHLSVMNGGNKQRTSFQRTAKHLSHPDFFHIPQLRLCSWTQKRHVREAKNNCPFSKNVYQHNLIKTDWNIFIRQYASTKSSNQNELLIKYVESLVKEYTDFQEGKSNEDLDRKQKQIRMQSLSGVVELNNAYKKNLNDATELKKLISGLPEDEKEMIDLAKKELEECEEQIDDFTQQISDCLIPDDEFDNDNIILEVHGAVGGQEAMLFAKEMFTMYQMYAQYKGWQFSILECDYSTGASAEGIRSASASVDGDGVYRLMKFEGGVHRVQRVPETESKGRIHTSTMTVAILPQPREINIKINPSDLKIESFKASGKGGQHVNTTDSAVRITHLPSGVKTECQETRSQIKNKEIALQKIERRLYQQQVDAQIAANQKERKIQVGTAERSEKIRTYNYNQDRITDHRIHQNMFNIQNFMSGGRELDNMIHLLLEKSRQEVLTQILENFGKENV